ncbi:probable serine/threonine-protein kinase pats1 [Anopheles darlingi]|uniref:probable serine/threonine-protein kinase pats1 n=1 Tax=Anopheles darlingi TaxID=43151 RepID=UPI002100554D|nr:probable serine/threonine-protein kinase pats1 [Anopheles darlingi]
MRAKCLIVFGALYAGLLASAVKGETFHCTNPDYTEDAKFDNVVITQSSNYDFACSYLAHYKLFIYFDSSQMEDIPRKLFSTFNAQKVVLSDCGIRQISRYSLERASQLQVLDLSHNSIAELKNFVFQGAYQLLTLNLTANNISVIEERAFDSLEMLKMLLLGSNSLQVLDGRVFVSLTALEGVVLSNNQLRELGKGLFTQNGALREVHLQSNQLANVTEEAFWSSDDEVGVNLDELVLNKNIIKQLSLPNMHVNKLKVINNQLTQLHISTTVAELYCSHNKISEIVIDNASKSQLHTLDITNNTVSSLESIAQYRSLHTLYLGVNPLKPLNVSSFATLTKLKNLGLEQTNITNLRHGMFGHQEQLEWLDLAFNELADLDLDILTSCTKLETLYLDGNRLKSIDYEQMKTHFPQLALLGIAGNDWNCTYLTKLVRSCGAQSIKIYKETRLKAEPDQPNVKGISCLDDKHKTRNWTATIEELHTAYNESDRADDAALTELFQNIMSDMKRYGDDHLRTINQTSRLEAALFDLTKQQFQLQANLNALRESQLKMELTQLSNRTNISSSSNEELKRMIENVNNLTLDKQQLTAQKLEQRIYEQSFKVDKALEMAKEIGAKLTILDKRMEQWVANIVNSDGTGLYLSKPQMQAQRGNDEARGQGDQGWIIATMLLLVVAVVCVLGYLVYERRRYRSHWLTRMRGIREESSLTTIVENQI